MTAPAIFPDTTILPGLDIKVIWRPKALNFAPQTHSSGREVIVGASAYPLHEFELIYNMLRNTPTQFEFKTLMGFFLQAAGTLNGFLFLNPWDNQVIGSPSATGDGSTTTFVLTRAYGAGGYSGAEPLGYLNLSAPFNVYVNSVPKTLGSDYTIDQTNPAAQTITFTATPAGGAAITIDASYYYYVRFLDDTTDFERLVYNIFQNKKITLLSKRAAPILVTVPPIVIPRAAAPTSSPLTGTSFSGTQSVTLASTTPGAVIRYTTDGSTPGTGSAIYYGVPFDITATTTVKSFATATGYTNSAVTSTTFTLASGSPSAPSPLTGVSLVAGNGEVFFHFTPGADNGATVTSRDAITNTGHTGTGLTSPILITGTPNGTPVTATGTQTNSVSASTPSAVTNSVTPTAGTVVTGTITGAVYTAGVFHWAGDWNGSANPIDYAYAAAGVAGPGPVIRVFGSTANMYWLPYPPNNPLGPASNGVNFNLAGKTYFKISVKPSVAGGQLSMGFYKAVGTSDDIPFGHGVTITQAAYGPASMTPGVWNTYKIPLVDFAVSGWIYKFILQQQGVTPQVMLYDEVGFL